MGWLEDVGSWIGDAGNWMLDLATDYPEKIAEREEASGGTEAYVDTSDRSIPSENEVEKSAIKSKGEGLISARLDLPMEFNPPLHPTMRMTGTHAVAGSQQEDILDAEGKVVGRGHVTESMQDNYKDADKIVFEPDAVTHLPRNAEDWRLGQIVPSDLALKTPEEVRYGFRFLYNPPSLSFSTGVNTSIHADQGNAAHKGLLYMKNGQGQIDISLLLNRIADVSLGNASPPGQALLQDPEKEVVARAQWSAATKGTEIDLEYLFRTINGVWDVRDTGEWVEFDGDGTVLDPNLTDEDKEALVEEGKLSGDEGFNVFKTGDLGALLPTPVWLSIGPTMKFYGRVQTLSHEHFMFNKDMIPLLTRVTITFQRIFRSGENAMTDLNTASDLERGHQGNLFENTAWDGGGDGTGDGSGGGDTVSLEPVKRFLPVEKKLPNGSGTPESVLNTISIIRGVGNNYPSIKTMYGQGGAMDHERGLAVDIMMPNGTADSSQKMKDLGDKIAKDLMRNCKFYGTRQIIWDRKIWTSTTKIPSLKWGDSKVYTGRGTAHVDHIHAGAYPSAKFPGNPYHIYKGTALTSGGGTSGKFKFKSRVGWLPEKNGVKKVPKPNPGSMNGEKTRKLVLHTTEGDSIASAEGTMSDRGNIFYHMVVDQKRKVVHQYYPLGNAARSMGNGPNNEPNNRYGTACIQVSFVGFASTTPMASLTHWSKSLLTEICRSWDIPLIVTQDHKTKSWKNFKKSGITSHGSAPGTGAWDARTPKHIRYDPGKIPKNFLSSSSSSSSKSTRRKRSRRRSTSSTHAIEPAEPTLRDYLGVADQQIKVQRMQRHSLYQRIDGQYWIIDTPSEIRQYPRNAHQALVHGVSYIVGGVIPSDSWVGRPMTAVARCFGLKNAATSEIPINIPGPTSSPARQFRWLAKNHPSMVVYAPHARSFGTSVPIGAILYWGEGVGGGFGSVGIAMGYQNGLLQQMTADDSVGSLVIKDVQPNNCLGWTVPIFYAPPTMTALSLIGGD